MAGKPINFTITGDAKDFQRALDSATTSSRDFERASDDLDKASRNVEDRMQGVADSSDEVASRGEQAAGALTGLGELIGGPFGAAMTGAGIALQAAADSGDLLNAALEGVGLKAARAVEGVDVATEAVTALDAPAKSAAGSVDEVAAAALDVDANSGKAGKSAGLLTGALTAMTSPAGLAAIAVVGVAAGVIAIAAAIDNNKNKPSEMEIALEQVEKGAKDADTAFDGLSSSLDATGENFVETARDIVASTFQQNEEMREALDVGKEYGLNLRDLTDAALGNEDATQKVNGAIAEMDKRIESNKDQQKDLQGMYDSSQSRGSAWNSSLEDQIRSLEKENEGLRINKGRLKGTRDEIIDNAQETAEYAHATGTLDEYLRGLPKKVRSEINIPGVIENGQRVKNLKDDLNSIPSKVWVDIGISSNYSGGSGLEGLLFGPAGIPKYAAGTITSGPHLAVVGDNASGRELILPEEKWEEFAQVVGGFGGGNVYVSIDPKDLQGIRTVEEFVNMARVRSRQGI